MRQEEIEVPVGSPAAPYGRREGAADVLAGYGAPRSGAVPYGTPGTQRDGDASIGELLKSLTSDTSDLLRNEVALAKAEMSDMARGVAGDAARMGAAAGLALVGGLALGAFLVIGLGILLGGAYWLSALIVGVVFVGAGAVIGKSAANDMKTRGFRPERTIETLRADKEWASRQARELKHDLTTDPASTPYISR